jgi:hypothetical protein
MVIVIRIVIGIERSIDDEGDDVERRSAGTARPPDPR